NQNVPPPPAWTLLSPRHLCVRRAVPPFGDELVTLRFAPLACPPRFLLGGRRLSQADGYGPRNHRGRTGNDQSLGGSAFPAQFSEYQGAPRQAPELVRVRQRDPSPDANVLCRVLLEEVSQDPAESSQEEPKQGPTRLGKFLEERRKATAKNQRQRRHREQFTDRKNRHEGKRVHAAD